MGPGIGILLGLLTAVGVAVWLIASDSNPLTEAGEALLNVVTRGARLTHTSLDGNGDIAESPEFLASSVGVSSDEYALARMLASEEENSSQQTKVAIAWVAVNVAAARGQSITRLLTTDNNDHGDGKFGKQTGRWASTASDPYEGDLTISQAVLSGAVSDPTGGAVHFFNPSLQDRLFGLGKVTKTSDEIDSSWGGAGFKVAGVNPDVTFYRNA